MTVGILRPSGPKYVSAVVLKLPKIMLAISETASRTSSHTSVYSIPSICDDMRQAMVVLQQRLADPTPDPAQPASPAIRSLGPPAVISLSGSSPQRLYPYDCAQNLAFGKPAKLPPRSLFP